MMKTEFKIGSNVNGGVIIKIDTSGKEDRYTVKNLCCGRKYIYGRKSLTYRQRRKAS